MSWNPLWLVPLGCALSLVGCAQGNLEGDWDGSIDCGGSGSPDIEVAIDQTDDYDYEGEGTVSHLKLDGEAVEVVFFWEMHQNRVMGVQSVDINAECQAVPKKGDRYAIDCSDMDEIGWDGQDLMAAEINDFLNTGEDCTLTISR